LKKINIASKKQIIESTDSYSIVMIGAGNVSTHISRHFHSVGQKIDCIYSKTQASAETLAEELGVPGTSRLDDVPQGADFYIVAVPDDAVPGIAEVFKYASGIWLHTAGALHMDVFKGIFENYGVLYPLQTLSRERALEAKKIPILVEASSPEILDSVTNLAVSAYEHVVSVDSEKRLVLQTAAVFANNFSNHMVHIASQLLADRDIEPDVLNPLLEETLAKILSLGPEKGQTGPAVRGDRLTMNKHIELLKGHPEWEKLYTFISREIERSRK
jgi:predicted short-subunit dehydrogenase-like oxidoreductase (DUF2520 family)